MVEAYADEIDSDVIELKIKRSGGDHINCEVSLKITDKGELKGGWLGFNNLTETDGSLRFGPDGSVLKVGDKDPDVLTQLEGKKLSLAKIINAVTTGNNLGQEKDIEKVLHTILSSSS
jgi:hypothetical protein